MKRYFALVVFICIAAVRLLSQQKLEITALNRITLNKGDTTYQFYTIKPYKNIKFKSDGNYFWYVSDTILITQQGYDGKLLNGTYKVFYPNKNLKEEGFFNYGLKTGQWRSWYPDGRLRNNFYWINGKENGFFEEYSQQGQKIKDGHFKEGKVSGYLNEYINDSLSHKILYKDGQIIESKEKKKDSSKINK